MAIQIGTIGSLAPERRSEVASLGLRALLAGSLANLANRRDRRRGRRNLTVPRAGSGKVRRVGSTVEGDDGRRRPP
ncbi:MAG TPA: nucleoside transporter C-terminal domain-containing protein [Segeticoccus sp.]|nr:nucleoside transporter C-terminal domain-containing protein [Segeticoccus sp.]